MFIGFATLGGSLVLSAWGGPKGKKVPVIIGFIALSAFGLTLSGIVPSIYAIISGLFIMLFNLPLASGTSQAIFQVKVAPPVQGGVFAIRSMISRSITPLAFLLAGLLADQLLEPLMAPTGALGGRLAGKLVWQRGRTGDRPGVCHFGAVPADGLHLGIRQPAFEVIGRRVAG